MMIRLATLVLAAIKDAKSEARERRHRLPVRVKGQNVCLGLVFSAVLARVSADIYGCWAYIGGVSVHSSVWCP
ncbi:hypothetical protein J2S67_000548 [Pseudoglutamicibacter albus]|uniref:Uncharacterized protein n=1 Tax=Pseudoglutamicibacter albus TaxID=98671 RepID=A0ABU1YZT0_9MICC|nr:hypothetical protein [Pseudoglutamicibacter albus]